MKKNKKASKLNIDIFTIRQEAHLTDARHALRQLYGDRPDFDQWIGRCLDIVCAAYKNRPDDLKQLDLKRTINPDWYLSQEMIGYICYTDRFVGKLKALPKRIPYLKELGVTYLHLMPLLQPRPAPNDGGYAVLDYRAVDDQIGSMQDLAQTAKACLLYTSPSPRDKRQSRMPSSA